MRNNSFLMLWDRFAMLETSGRLLRILALLQTRRDWNGPQLARELGVTTRTIRKDVGRLRALGYPVDAAPGVAGGYRLGAGTSLPPLLLDDEEAVAVAVGLRAAGSGGGIAGIEETSLRALAKLEQVLPSRLRQRVNMLQGVTTAIPSSGPTVAADVLTAIAAAIRAREQLRFDYVSFDGAASRRTVEPHRLVHTRGRWFLVAWDVERVDWRTFRADRIRPRTPTGPRFAARQDPDGNLIAYVEKGLGSAMWRYRARAKVHAPAADVAACLPPAVTVESVDERTCLIHVGSDSLGMLAVWLGMLDAEFEVDNCPELADHLRKLADRYTRAVR
jgi:predicted DNA-binding transcriptional regulator YafY